MYMYMYPIYVYLFIESDQQREDIEFYYNTRELRIVVFMYLMCTYSDIIKERKEDSGLNVRFCILHRLLDHK